MVTLTSITITLFAIFTGLSGVVISLFRTTINGIINTQNYEKSECTKKLKPQIKNYPTFSEILEKNNHTISPIMDKTSYLANKSTNFSIGAYLNIVYVTGFYVICYWGSTTLSKSFEEILKVNILLFGIIILTWLYLFYWAYDNINKVDNFNEFRKLTLINNFKTLKSKL